MDNDIACDVYARYIYHFNTKRPHPEILAEIEREYAEPLADEDDGPPAWLAIAKAQWDCGALSDRILERARRIVEDGVGLDRWETARDKAAYRKRLVKFLDKLRTPNPRPKKPKNAVKRKPVHQPGDCLAVRLSDGDWGAVLVLACPPESDDPFEDTYGINLIATLRYKAKEPPALDVFERREWLVLTHHSWAGKRDLCNVAERGYKKVRARIERVGQIALRPDDPTSCNTYSGWEGVGLQVVLQLRWERGER